jgi:hypothetical protein
MIPCIKVKLQVVVVSICSFHKTNMIDIEIDLFTKANLQTAGTGNA